jgi:hypothetical protein
MVCACANAKNGNEFWTPEVEFSLENSDYIETLLWVSGNSYAYSSIVKEMSQSKIFCVESVGSKVILDILNSKFSNTKITSEQASAEIKSGLVRKFPCK